MSEHRDFWDADDFEHTVASALIACFETKVKKNRGACPWDRLNDQRIAILRSEGPYIASNSRYVSASTDMKIMLFDMENDRLPVKGLFAFTPGGMSAASRPNAYLFAQYIRQAPALGRCWHRRSPGVLYEMFSMNAENDGIHGERSFFTVAPSGVVTACTQEIASFRFSTSFGRRVSTVGCDDEWLQATAWCGGAAVQFLADRRHCWSITAQENAARAHLGCMMEEVKSLLYARSLPMTSTGRKRPILHLVEAHKRRMRSGTDVDVTAFLRGQQAVEIGGTAFRVNPPADMRPHLSAPSQKRYFETASS